MHKVFSLLVVKCISVHFIYVKFIVFIVIVKFIDVCDFYVIN